MSGFIDTKYKEMTRSSRLFYINAATVALVDNHTEGKLKVTFDFDKKYMGCAVRINTGLVFRIVL